MGGFLLIFFLIPASVLLFLLWLITRSKWFGWALGLMWLGIFALISIAVVVHIFTSKKEVKESDIYGQYIIDRSKFPGKQADWQYNHFRFEIKRGDSIIFYETDGEKIIKTYRAAASFRDGYYTPHLVLSTYNSAPHIITGNPTIYRTVWSFYYVFYSKKFGNVFFKKGKWREL